MTLDANSVPSAQMAGVVGTRASGFYMRVRGLAGQPAQSDDPLPHSRDPQWCREVVTRAILGPHRPLWAFFRISSGNAYRESRWPDSL